MKKKEKCSGAEQFESYYQILFKDRWPSLKESLLGEPIYVSYDAGGKENYFLDPASVLAAQSLPLEGAINLLDLCAAPGGKTLVIACSMDEQAHLDSNERSPERKQRLDHVIQNSLSMETAARVRTSCSDGATWCTRQTECYDRILLDAPCSSERHVLGDQKYLSQWTPNRIKSLAIEQWALLSSAWRLLVPGGFLLYATCALSPKENDEVVQRLLKKFPDVEPVWKDRVSSDFEKTFNIDQKQVVLHPEKTEFGLHVLPDTSGGAGPLYFSLLQKKCNLTSE